MAGFLSPLDLEYIDGRKWKILNDFQYCIGGPDGYPVVDVPAGFITDFASVPRILWNILPPTGKYGKAAVVHDRLYQSPHLELCVGYPSFKVDRYFADLVLLEGMEVLKVDWLTRWIIYLGVRIGGWMPWDGYRSKE